LSALSESVVRVEEVEELVGLTLDGSHGADATFFVQGMEPGIDSQPTLKLEHLARNVVTGARQVGDRQCPVTFEVRRVQPVGDAGHGAGMDRTEVADPVQHRTDQAGQRPAQVGVFLASTVVERQDGDAQGRVDSSEIRRRRFPPSLVDRAQCRDGTGDHCHCCES